MTWSKTEQETINKQNETLEEIKTALLGDLKTKEPGLIDDVRDINVAVEGHTKQLEVNMKQHLYLLLGITLCAVGLVYGLLGGTFTDVLEFVARIKS